jgi:hypothetical protein
MLLKKADSRQPTVDSEPEQPGEKKEKRKKKR